MARRRLGLFGGTFDPPHLGHVAALSAAWRTGRYVQICVTVAGDPWQKSKTRTLSSASVRLAMAQAAFSELDGVEVSDVELRRGGPTYTVDTVDELLAQGWEVELLIGADAAEGIDDWHEASRLSREVSVAVFPRDERPIAMTPAWDYFVVDMEPVDLSSSILRERAESGEDLRPYVPAHVMSLWSEGRG